MEFAKEAAQRFWDIQNRTLLEWMTKATYPYLSKV
jgi:hypothetical protein